MQFVPWCIVIVQQIVLPLEQLRAVDEDFEVGYDARLGLTIVITFLGVRALELHKRPRRNSRLTEE